MSQRVTRREILLGTAGAAAAGLLRCAGVAVAPDADADAGTATPACPETPDNPLGHAYLEGAPFRTELNVLGWPGEPLEIVGQVRGPDCKTPIAKALIDVWGADSDGKYDGDSDAGSPDPAWPLRGRLYAAEDGHYSLTTLLPGFEPGRTRHVHVRVSAPGYPTLVTQIYFTGVPENAQDPLIRPGLITPLHDHGKFLHVVFPLILGSKADARRASRPRPRSGA
jgi:protocatechuate 3,4-dioxygenase beta subunit